MIMSSMNHSGYPDGRGNDGCNANARNGTVERSIMYVLGET